jgi:hypothetical protein
MWSVESSKRMIKKIIKEYGKEILQEGSESVLGLKDHLDEIVAKAMNIDKDCVTLARQWRIIIERAAITEAIDKVKNILEQENKTESSHNKSEETVIEEVKMIIEDKISLEEEKNITITNIEIEISIEEDTNKEEEEEIMEDIEVIEETLNSHISEEEPNIMNNNSEMSLELEYEKFSLEESI